MSKFIKNIEIQIYYLKNDLFIETILYELFIKIFIQHYYFDYSLIINIIAFLIKRLEISNFIYY